METTQLKRSAKNQILGFIGWLLLVFAAAALGGLASSNAPEFYGQLTQPNWAPPAWLFGPVWSALYGLMAISAFLVWRKHGWASARPALIFFIIQLALNALWTPLFFLWQQGALAFIEIIVLWMWIVATIVAFWRLNARLAAVLLLPYLAWVSFATCLTWAMWQLNPGVLG
jgi:tryptophan-rich sensory protein